MNIAEVVLGSVVILSGLAVSAGVLVSKNNGKGLSAAIGGMSPSMMEKKISSSDKMVEKIVIAGASVCGVAVMILGMIAAHVR